MKKKILLILIIILMPINVFASEKQEVKFSSCVDGDTARFIMNKEEIKVRFLAIDTPETNHPKKGEEPYGREAKEYTCNKITNASKIELEFDDNSDKKDKYNRYLAWVFVDDSLLQSELVLNGYARVAYLYGDYKYKDILNENMEKAKKDEVGIFSKVDTSYYTTHKNDKNKNSEVTNKDNEKIKKKIEKKLTKKIIASIEKFLKDILDDFL